MTITDKYEIYGQYRMATEKADAIRKFLALDIIDEVLTHEEIFVHFSDDKIEDF